MNDMIDSSLRSLYEMIVPGIDGAVNTVGSLVQSGRAKLKAVAGDVMEPTGDMKFSGWLSTPARDLAGDSILATAWQKYWGYYVRNPIYLFNHDYKAPCGHVEEPQLIIEGDVTGVYLKNVSLAPTVFNLEFLWPLIDHGSLKQQSAGFLSLNSYYDSQKKLMIHDETYLLEGSGVAVACNPTAVIDNKAFKAHYAEVLRKTQMPDSLDTIYALLQNDRLKPPSECSKQFFVGSVGFQEQEEEQAPDPVDGENIEMIKATKSSEVPAILKMDMADVYAAKAADAYILPLKKTVNEEYSPMLVKSSSHLFYTQLAKSCDNQEFLAINAKFEKAYKALDIEAPKVANVKVFDLTDVAQLATEVKFYSDEAMIGAVTEMLTATQKVLDLKAQSVEKYVYTSFEIWVSPRDAEEANLISSLLATLFPAAASDSPDELPLPVEDSVEDLSKVEKTADDEATTPAADPEPEAQAEAEAEVPQLDVDEETIKAIRKSASIFSLKKD